MHMDCQTQGPVVDGRVSLETLVNIMKQAVYTLDRYGEVVEDSPSWRQFTGQALEDYLGMNWLNAIHPDDRTTFLTTWKNIVATGMEGAFEYRLWHHTGEWRHVLERTCPSYGSAGEVIGWIGIIIDISRRKRVEEQLIRTTELALRRAAEVEQLYRQSPIGLGMFDRNLRYVRVSERLAHMNGFPIDAHIGKSLSEIYPDGSAQLEPLYRKILETGVTISDIEIQDQLNSAGDALGSTRHFSGHAYPVTDPDGTVVAVGTIWQDISEQKRAEATQKLLNMELIHRTKNLITVIQSVTARSLIDDQPVEPMRHALLSRLEAISRAYASLTETNWQGAPLHKLITRECEQHHGVTVTRGPDLVLNASAAQTFALVIHELTTNATKHGSLSVPGGKVSISWVVESGEDGNRFRLRWRESMGPRVAPPKRKGFGHTLLHRMMSNSEEYVAVADYAPEGLIYDLDVELETMLAKQSDGALFQARASAAA